MCRNRGCQDNSRYVRVIQSPDSADSGNSWRCEPIPRLFVQISLEMFERLKMIEIQLATNSWNMHWISDIDEYRGSHGMQRYATFEIARVMTVPESVPEVE